jgi:hypothetical protein
MRNDANGQNVAMKRKSSPIGLVACACYCFSKNLNNKKKHTHMSMLYSIKNVENNFTFCIPAL